MSETPWGRHTRWLTCITVDPAAFGAHREQVRLALDTENIEARPVWKPMHLQPVFAGCEAIGGAVAESHFEEGSLSAVGFEFELRRPSASRGGRA